MTMRTEQTQNSERIREFVQLLLEAMPKITDPLPETLTQLLNALDELPPQGQTPPYHQPYCLHPPVQHTASKHQRDDGRLSRC